MGLAIPSQAFQLKEVLYRKKDTSQRQFLSSTKTIGIGTWKFRTIYEAGKTAQIAREARNCNITVFDLCETKWSQSEHVRPQETHTLCVFDRLPVVSWRRAKYKQMYGLKSTLTVSR